MGGIGGIVSIAFAVWFYVTAEKKKAPAIQWAVAGFISYFVPWLIWVKLVGPKKIPFSPSISILVGATCAFLILTFVLKKIKQPD
jgi:hypothetical protein